MRDSLAWQTAITFEAGGLSHTFAFAVPLPWRLQPSSGPNLESSLLHTGAIGVCRRIGGI